MNSDRRWRVPLVGIFVIIGVAYVLWRDSTPVARGRHLCEWLVHCDPHESNTPQGDEAVVAIRELGTTAIPFLLKDLKARDLIGFSFGASASDRRRRAVWGFRILGTNAAVAIPALQEIVMRGHPDTVVNAIQVLQELGVEGVHAIASALTNRDWNIRYTAVNTLCGMGTNARPVASHVLLRLADSNASVAYAAANVVSDVGISLPLALNELTNALASGNPIRRGASAFALGLIGSNAAVALPSLTNCLSDTNLDIRDAAARAIQQITGTPDK